MYCTFMRQKKKRGRCLYAHAGIKEMLATVRENVLAALNRRIYIACNLA